MKILVTGGSGYLGTHIRQAFSADDLSRRSGYDVTRHQQCRMVAEYDLVIHLAARMDKSAAGAELPKSRGRRRNLHDERAGHGQCASVRTRGCRVHFCIHKGRLRSVCGQLRRGRRGLSDALQRPVAPRMVQAGSRTLRRILRASAGFSVVYFSPVNGLRADDAW